jgi:hypothetical protein
MCTHNLISALYVSGFSTRYITKKKTCIVKNEHFLVKTHRSDDLVSDPECFGQNSTWPGFRKAVFILRNPYNAILAEYKRRHSGSTTHVSKLSEMFYLTKGKTIFD